ncbi:MAG: amidohydrolase [Oscillospiraceae bacterium]|nr:amidohydrolase [Oscillospiraceae bacterium]
MDFWESVLEIKNDLIKWRRAFHSHPELSFEEWKTSSFIKVLLKSEGIEYKEYANTGIVATIYGNGTKTVAVRADMDALPITELKFLEYSSKEKGKMHACGHDAHMAMVLGAIKIINKFKDRLKGNVKFIFEPGEEDTGGASIMIYEGCLKNPDVLAIIGLHVREDIDSGKIGIKKGIVNVSSNPFKIIIEGKGGHGAFPENTVDPIFVACQMIMAIQGIITRELPATVPTVITIGEIKAGSSGNIIPKTCEINGIIRTLKDVHRQFIKKRIVEIGEGIAKSFRAEAAFNIIDGYPALLNDNKIMDIVEGSAKKVVGEENIIYLENPLMSVESFAYFAKEKPCAFYFLGIRNEEKGIIYPAHSPQFDIDEDALLYGTCMHCTALFDLLENL